jgi:membrane fusion protein (multidrug efflux system)
MVAELAPLGRMVNAGEVVVRLDDTVSQALRDQAAATLSAAEAQQDLAEATYRRKEALYRDSVISAMEFETVRAQRDQAVAHVRQARARLIQAEKQLADTRLIAPFRGTVEAHHVKPGEQVLPGRRSLALFTPPL